MATLLDAHGGGHANACGCRVVPVNDVGEPVARPLEAEDLERNMAGWLKVWARRDQRSS